MKSPIRDISKNNAGSRTLNFVAAKTAHLYHDIRVPDYRIIKFQIASEKKKEETARPRKIAGALVISRD